MNKKITVIIPAYNRAETIERCILSVIEQGYEDLEVLVCDDYSKDNTTQIVENIGKRYDCVKCLIREDGEKGANPARNNGIVNASGEYLVFLDSDDVLASGSIEKRLAVFEKDPDLDMVYGDVAVQGERVRFERIQDFHPKNYMMREMSLCPFSTMMIKKSSLEGLPLLDKELPAWQDDAFILSLVMNDRRLQHSGEIVAEMNFGEGEGNITFSYRKRYIGCKNLVHKYRKEIIEQQSIFWYFLWKLRVLMAWLAAKAQEEQGGGYSMVLQ